MNMVSYRQTVVIVTPRILIEVEREIPGIGGGV